MTFTNLNDDRVTALCILNNTMKGKCLKFENNKQGYAK